MSIPTCCQDAIKNCKDLADHVVCVCALQRKSYSYTGAYVVSDDYSVESSLKDHTCIKDFNNFLSSTRTKDRLTLYLAEKLINKPCLFVK